MKRILFTMVTACAAFTNLANAEIWGRNVPYSYVARTMQENAEPLPNATQGPVAHGPQQSPVQSPIQGHVQAPIQGDGYPFADRCGSANSTCCDNVWAGYSRPLCGLKHGLFAHHGCGKCGGHHFLHGLHGLGGRCNDCGGCGGCGTGGCAGGCFNSFAGGACCSGFAGGGLHGLGLHGGLFHGGCGCGHKLHHHLRRMCGLGCGCESIVGTAGCGCGGHDAALPAPGKSINPPVPPIEPTPAIETLPSAAQTGEKSAFRTNGWFPRAGF